MGISATLPLNTGSHIPVLGLGVYQTKPGAETENAALWALEAGYRHIDTAAVYKNEASVGAAVKKSAIPRKGIFVTTKLGTGEFDDPQRALTASLARLGMDYVDMYLLHWPVEGKRLAAWGFLEKLHHRGLCRAIG